MPRSQMVTFRPKMIEDVASEYDVGKRELKSKKQ